MRLRAGKTILSIAIANKLTTTSIILCTSKCIRIENTSVPCANRSTNSKVSSRYKRRFTNSQINEKLSPILQPWHPPLLSSRIWQNYSSDTNDLSGKGVRIISRIHDRHRNRGRIIRLASLRSFAVII